MSLIKLTCLVVGTVTEANARQARQKGRANRRTQMASDERNATPVLLSKLWTRKTVDSGWTNR